jgi:DNA-binding XRE family transcriptional regulator
MSSTVPQSDFATVDGVWNRGKRRPKNAPQTSTTVVAYIYATVVVSVGGFGSGGGLTVDDRGGGRGVQMTPDEIRGARVLLGLSQSQLAELLETDAQTVRRMEMDQNRSTHRLPAPRMCRLIMAYVDGYRPNDWPWEV